MDTAVIWFTAPWSQAWTVRCFGRLLGCESKPWLLGLQTVRLEQIEPDESPLFFVSSAEM